MYYHNILTSYYIHLVNFVAEQGQVFVFMGGPNFPKGDATSKCNDRYMLDPCPGYKVVFLLFILTV